MKRLFILLFSVIFLLNICGCSQKNGDPVNNDVFTDKFFENVVEIRFGDDDPVTGDQLVAVARFLKSLHLTHSEEELPTEKPGGYYGGYSLVYMQFIKPDGTSLEIRLNEWAMSGLPGGSYYVTDYIEALERGDKNILRSLWEACGRDPNVCPF